MHRLWRADDLAAYRLAERLVAEADAEQRHIASAAYQFEADAGAVGIARPRRDDDALRLHRQRLVDAQGVVTPHSHFRPQLSQKMPEVVGEAVVVIDEQEHARFRS